ncbi:chemotaxis protein methyltransferase CheR [Candidatus Magnetomorum sp. HK-1]|nr:chemotaxis protein methyltransferase CheR [Candidatus Magnetomorum sp. HK-1]
MFQSLCSWITKKTGHHITKDNFDRIALVLNELSKENGISEEEYAYKVINETIESQYFIDKYMTTESYFMRYKPNMELVARQFLPNLIKKGIKPHILSIPCARGEEPYSMAMLLIDAGIALNKVDISAVDISKYCIQTAQKGEFTSYSFRRLPKSYIQKYFRKTSRNIYTISSDIRSSVKFIQMNVLTDAQTYFSPGINVLFCHNLFIYFNRTAIDKTLKLFEYLMDDNGWLFVDSSEGAHVEKRFKRSIINDSIFVYRKYNSGDLKKSFYDTNTYIGPHIMVSKPKETSHLSKKTQKKPIKSFFHKKTVSRQINNFDQEIYEANTAYEAKNFSTAINIFESIIKKNSSNEPFARLGLAKIHADCENDLEALENAEYALKLDQQAMNGKKLSGHDKEDLYALIALILQKKGIIQKAQYYFSQLKQLNSNHPALIMEEK